MSKPANFFESLAGVPVHYDRFPEPEFAYGTRGKPLRFHCQPEFEDKLHDCFDELWEAFGEQAEVITSAGAWVDKPGAHGAGRALDIDGIFWPERTLITLNYPQDRQLYLGVQAILHKHFGTVLNYEYNAGHRDHFHIADTMPLGFDASRRTIGLFLQMSLTHLFELPVEIDGDVGPQTNGALRNLLVDLEFADDDEVATDAGLHDVLDDQWFDLLDEIAAWGLDRPAETDKTPLDLLRDVYSVIENELTGDPRRKRIETALTTFAQHSDTDAFLEQFR